MIGWAGGEPNIVLALYVTKTLFTSKQLPRHVGLQEDLARTDLGTSQGPTALCQEVGDAFWCAVWYGT